MPPPDNRNSEQARKSTRFENLSRTRRALLLGTVIVTVSLTMAVLAEGAVRVRQWVKYGFLWGVEDTYSIDSSTGLRIPVPNSTTGPITINSYGFRSPEISLEKPPHTVRLAFLGASTTYCAEVSSDEATWPHRVWDELSEKLPKAKFDYLNAGVPGYSVGTSLKNFEQRVARFDPDVVIIYHATNDLSGNSFDLARARGLVENRVSEELSWLAHYSLLANLLEKNLRMASQEPLATGQKLEFDDRELTEPFERDLRALVRRVQESGQLAVLLTFSHQLRAGQSPERQSRAAQTSLYYMPYMSVEGLLRAFSAYNDVIRAVARDTGAVLIDVADSIPGDSEHFVDSVHFTDRGAAEMAGLVEDALLESPEFAARIRDSR